MKKLLSAILIVTASLFGSFANAASVTINNPSNPFSFTVNFGTLTLSYSGATVSTVVGMDQFPNQSYDNTATQIESAFSLPADTFDAEAIIDATYNTYKGNIAGSSVTINSDLPYDYLSLHLGGYNVFFQFDSVVNSPFTVNVLSATRGGGLSNYRTFDSDLTVVPVPAAAILFVPALLGFIALRRKAKAS